MARVSTPLFRLELTAGQRRQIRRVLSIEAAALELSLPDLKHLCTRAGRREPGPAAGAASRASRLQLRLTREHPAVPPAAKRPH